MQYTAIVVSRETVDVLNERTGKASSLDLVAAMIFVDGCFVGEGFFLLMWSFSRSRHYPGRLHGSPPDGRTWATLELESHLTDISDRRQALGAIQDAVDAST